MLPAKRRFPNSYSPPLSSRNGPFSPSGFICSLIQSICEATLLQIPSPFVRFVEQSKPPPIIVPTTSQLPCLLISNGPPLSPSHGSVTSPSSFVAPVFTN